MPGNWSFDNAVEARETSPYIRTATLLFTNGIFRFFTDTGNWDSGLNYSYFEDQEYTIDENIVSAEDDDGTYTITINSLDKTITLN